MRVVLDTSFLLAAFQQAFPGPTFSKDVYDHVVKKASAHVSDFILREFRAKCVRKFGFSAGQTDLLESLIKEKVRVERDPPIAGSAEIKGLRDRKDLPILQLALHIDADLLLTWDKDLLVLKRVKDVEILSPRQFWDMTT